MTKTANPGTVSQRKRNTVNQNRANVAQQQNNNTQQTAQQNKKTNKQNQSQNTTKTNSPASTPKPATTPVPPQTEQHVPLKGFNAAEIDKLLSSGFDAKTETYKPEQTTPQKTGGPWGQKPGAMATGKDFWLELRKQVATLQKGESTNKGG